MKVITVGNNKGGVGKTMCSFQLVCHLAHQGHKVLVIDLDSQANLSSTLGVNIQRTLIPEWLIGDVKATEIMLPVEGKEEYVQNIKLIPASRHMANLAKLLILSEAEVRKNAGRKERLLKMRLKEVENMFDFVVIDTPPMLGDELIMSLVASDKILIPTQAQDYSIDGLEELMVNPRRKIERQRLEELSQSFSVTPMIRNLVEMQESVALKKPVFKFNANSKGRRDYEALWDSLGL